MTDLPPRPGPTRRVRVVEHRVDADEPRRREDRLATEEPLEIRVAAPGSEAQRAWVTMRTPGHDFELAAGFLVHEGIASPEDIRGVAYCTDVALRAEQQFNVVTVTLAAPRPVPPRSFAASAGSSACGVCGKDSLDAVLATPGVTRWAGARPSVDVIRRLPARLREGQSLFARTGAVHAAGLADAEGRLLVVREDVGRHNAVDKVVGARILQHQPTAEACLVLSGRAGFELVQKAAAAGIGTVVAVGAPTSLAVDLAHSSGLGLYGFTGEDRCVEYAAP